ncbi:MAG: hypothetical protein U0559_10355 [Anaerolineae bacterium]
MLDKLLEVTGLYFHDVAGVSLAGASAAVAVSTLAGLIGNALIVPALERLRGVRVLRISAVVVLVAYVALLIVPVVAIKYVLIAVIAFATSGWFAILRAKCFEVLPGQSGLVIAVVAGERIKPVCAGDRRRRRRDQFAGGDVVLAIGPVALILGVR